MVGQTRCFNVHVTLVGRWLSVLLGCVCWWVFGLQITHQPLQAFLVGIVLFPVCKVPNVPLSSNSGCPRIGCILDGFIQRDGEEGRLSLILFLF